MTVPHEHEDQDDYCPNCGGDGHVYDCIDGMGAAGRPAPSLPSMASRGPTHGEVQEGPRGRATTSFGSAATLALGRLVAGSQEPGTRSP